MPFTSPLHLSSLDGSNGFAINGASANDHSGRSVSAAGDVNGDGIDDIIVGAPFTDDSGAEAGASWVIFGRSDGLRAAFDLSALDTNEGFVLRGASAGDMSGISVSAAGDVNGDLIDDLIVGALGADPNGDGTGASYVIFGRTAFPTALDLSVLQTDDGFVIEGVCGGDLVGTSVAAAGDVNGDGIDDLVIGASGVDAGALHGGGAYVVFGRPTPFGPTVELSALAPSAGFAIIGASFGDGAGNAVSGAGDVNGDGIGDLIIGASYAAPGSRGAAYVVFGGTAPVASPLSLDDLSGSDGFVMRGISLFDRAGVSVSTAGDVNGDDFDDVIVGAFFTDAHGLNAGASYVVFGRESFDAEVDLSALNGSDGFAVKGITIDDRSGGAVNAAGDVNGDGIDDLVIGAYGRPKDVEFGVTYVVFGKTSAFAPTVELSGLDGSAGFAIQGITDRDQSGFSVDGAGDVNGDGGADLIIGARYADANGVERAGASYVIFGDVPLPFPGPVELSDLGGQGFVINGACAVDFTGVSISAAGDVNDDGIDDLIVGANRADRNGNDYVGVSYVVYGQPGGFAGPIDLTGLALSEGFEIRGALADDYSGRSVSGAGDVNGDGIDDLLVGAPGRSIYSTMGSAYVVFGRNGDFTGPVDLGALDGSDGIRLRGALNNAAGAAVSAAGDMNGDGIADVIVGAYAADPAGRPNGGAAYVLFGRSDGFSTSTVDFSALNGVNGVQIHGADTFDGAGRSVGAAGDVNGDGTDDVIVGASDANGARGAAYVVFGSSTGFASPIELSMLNGANGFAIPGQTPGDYAGVSVDGAGDVNGDGVADIVVGVVGTSANAGASYVIFGRPTFAPTLALSDFDASDGFIIRRACGLDFSGGSVSRAGDLNGDGIDDLIVGAIAADPSGADSGAAYVVFGRMGATRANVDLSALDVSDGFAIHGASAGDRAGVSVRAAGDVNDDGLDDIAVGAFNADPYGRGDAGAGYVIYGRTAPPDNDPPNTLITDAPASPTNDATASFAFASDETATFEIALDGGGFTTVPGTAYTTGTLGEGLHTFQVRATDLAGNTDASPATRTFTVDTEAPDTTITGQPAALGNDATPTFDFAADETATFEVALLGGFTAVAGASFTSSLLSDGTYTFQVRATDAAGNTDASPAAHTFTIDTEEPETTIAGTPATLTNDATPTFDFGSPTDPASATFEVVFDGGGFTSVAGTAHTPAGLLDGTHTFFVRATDAAGNTDPSPAAVTFTIDTDDPETTIDSGPSGPTNNDDPVFDFGADEAATFEVALDGAGFTTATGTSQSYTDLGEGPHTFRVRAIDAAGNVDDTPATRTFTIDTIDPDTTILAGPGGLTADNDPTFDFGASEIGAGFEVALDGGGFATATGTSQSYTDLGEGLHTFAVRAIDGAGNVDDTPAMRTFTIDTVPPDTTILTGPSGPIVGDDAAFTFDSEDDATFEVALDGGGFGTIAGTTQSYTDLAEGLHTFQVRARDAAGNVDPTPDLRTFLIDTGDPDTTITSGPSGPTANNDPVFHFTSDEDASFAFALDGGPLTTIAGTSQAYANLADGPHTFRVHAIDGLGNEDATPAVRVFTIDTSAPGPTTVSSFASDTGTIGDGVTTDRSLTVAGIADPLTTVRVFRDGVQVGTTGAAADGTWSFADPATQAFGARLFTARGVDGAGNVGPLSAPLEVLVVNPAAVPSNGPDLVMGDAGANVIQGVEGNDTILGEAGNDTLRGGNGSDSLLGGDGADRLEGGNDADTARGGGGTDSLYGENGNDRLYGEAANDRIEAGAGLDSADGGAGNDTVYGGADTDTLFGDAGADQLYGDAGGDWLLPGIDAARDSILGTAAQLTDDTIDGFIADSLAGAGIASDADMVFVTGMTNAQRALIDGDLLDAQGRLFLPGGGALTFLGHAGAEVDAVLGSGGVQIWLV